MDRQSGSEIPEKGKYWPGPDCISRKNKNRVTFSNDKKKRFLQTYQKSDFIQGLMVHREAI